MKSIITLFILLSFTLVNAQYNKTFEIKQSQVSGDCENFVGLPKNDIYASISFHQNYLRFNLSNGSYIDKSLNEMEQVVYDNHYALDYIEERGGSKVSTRIVMVKDPNEAGQYKPIFIFMAGVGLLKMGEMTCMKFVFENKDKI